MSALTILREGVCKAVLWRWPTVIILGLFLGVMPGRWARPDVPESDADGGEQQGDVSIISPVDAGTDILARLDGAERELKETVVGQDRAIESIVRGLRGHFGMRGTKPVSILVMGGLGLGKSTLIQTLARTVYQSEPVDFKKFAELAKRNDNALRQGGVVHLKGIEGLQTLNSDYLQEPALANWIFVFELNIGFNAIAAAGDDYTQIARWRTLNTRERLVKLLCHVLGPLGVTTVLLRKVDQIVLQKPLTYLERIAVAQRVVGSWLAELNSRSSFKITVSDNSYKTLANYYFSQEGAHRIEHLLRTELSGYIVANAPEKVSRLEVDFKSIPGEGVSFYMTKPPKSRVQVTIEAFSGSGQAEDIVAKTQVEIKGPARTFYRIDSALHTAFHEAGHAAAHDPDVLGYRVGEITINPQGNSLGITHFDIDRWRGYVGARYDENWLFESAVVALSGGIAPAELGGMGLTLGRSGDVDQLKNQLTRFILESGIVPELDAGFVQYGSDGELSATFSERRLERAESFAAQIVEAAHEEARSRVRVMAPLIEKVALHLLAHGEMSGDHFYHLRERFLEGLDQLNREGRSDILVKEFGCTEDGRVKAPLTIFNVAERREIRRRIADPESNPLSVGRSGFQDRMGFMRAASAGYLRRVIDAKLRELEQLRRSTGLRGEEGGERARRMKRLTEEVKQLRKRLDRLNRIERR